MSKKPPAEKQVSKYKDYHQVFGSPAGKRVLYDLMETGFVLGSTFVHDSHETALREGGRNMVLRILKILNTNPEQLRAMIAEGAESNE